MQLVYAGLKFYRLASQAICILSIFVGFIAKCICLFTQAGLFGAILVSFTRMSQLK